MPRLPRILESLTPYTNHHRIGTDGATAGRGGSDVYRAILREVERQRSQIELIAKGKRQAARYSWERTAREVLDVYRDVTDTARTA